MHMQHLYKISFGNLYTDAFATDEFDRLLFASIIGRNADIQSFIATVALRKMENLIIKDPDDSCHGAVGYWRDFWSQSENLTKSITKVTTQNYGVLEHMFLYDARLNKMDYGAKSTWMVAITQQEIDQLLWGNIKALSEVPLMDHWQGLIVDTLQEHITTPKNTVGNIFFRHLQLPGTFEETISDLVKTGQLTV